ncbi:LLM class flavin-dependent oxidoreductase [Lysinibacter sp. HNR]|uniref:LLM class flavin-dependent oxidoreductase n=1 Tax=Lysinibacter sp. HNR TaxID=3031408 RepID=UPI0024349C9A|nr:LLM class flavin-dependent oxidoreductase [Lysinibacter sp. HNR]WGD36792.1 LLM class flavin-dependent oxidoreductase [Lysinibacter sp. HNR]
MKYSDVLASSVGEFASVIVMTVQRLKLGFLSFVPNDYGPLGAGRALREGVELFQFAEELGYQSGWVRVRHFEPYLSSPMTFLSAVGQRTHSIALGTGVIPARYEDPIRLAEDAATVDLLIGGRLELGLSTGIGGLASILDPVFGESDRSLSEESQYRIERLRRALEGYPVAHSGQGFMSVPPETDLHVTPENPDLAERLWYGAGSLGSSIRSGEQGFDLHVSTLITEGGEDVLEVRQTEHVRAYREAFAASEAGNRRRGRVAVGRIVLPTANQEDSDAHAGYIKSYKERMRPDGRPHDPSLNMRFSRLHTGSSDAIVDSLAADTTIAEADTLIITLPAPGGIEAHRRVLRTVAEEIAPELGWNPR